MVVAEGFQSRIDIHLRMRPVNNVAIAGYEVDQESNAVEWVVPRQATAGMHNHQREKYNFSFTGILGTDCKQDEVFDTVAKKVVLGALDGYNGTIFAYGQTGSGKTYTITGGTERYVDRGIIPRALSLIFSELAKRSEYRYQLHFSYMEIYNETGYDLLNPDHETKALEDLPKVTMLEDEDNCFHLRNLSQHLATNEEEALNLLFVGDTNRMISATPMNLASSRSHCIFSVSVEARKAGEDTVRKSKLHLVDLAGSERVWKKGIDGQVLKEAKYINLSLHYLEQVIIALQERSQGKPRHHIPYRNSMMTSVLRDSLGGNCLTVMIATVTVAQEQLEETISTCRFAQRVALISNQVMLNEEVDPSLVIKRLKQEIKDLKEELHYLRGDNERGPLTASELNILRSQISSYVADKSEDATVNCGGSMMQIRAAFQVFKEMICKQNGTQDSVENSERTDDSAGSTAVKSADLKNTSTLQETISNLNHQLQQRDNEINILVSFIKRERGTVKKTMSTQWPEIPGGEDEYVVADEKGADQYGGQLSKDLDMQRLSTVNQGDRLKAFEIFKSSYPSWDAIEENKKILKDKYREAKSLGEKVNNAREKINEMKAQVEKLRVDRALQNLTEGIQPSDIQSDPAEDQLITTIEKEKRAYKENFNDLRDIKKEIEHLHFLLQQSRIRLQVDFEQWLNPNPKSEVGSACKATSGTDFRNWTWLQNQSSQSPMLPSRPSSRAKTSHHTDLSTIIYPGEAQRLLPAKLAGLETKHDLFVSRNGKDTPSEEQTAYRRSDQRPGASSTRSSTPMGPRDRSSLQLTGDVETDADILAFYQARDNILQATPR